jgi:hypothetical protein
MSLTPLTDAADDPLQFAAGGFYSPSAMREIMAYQYHSVRNLCRKLERELVETKAQLAKAHEELCHHGIREYGN